ncbi:MAG: hypothetical protein HYY56_07025 [Candidatus Omnitrophica bacterium]|nr:hypothetical protein [Candidatus Omnitrophota bacterium]
MVRYKRVLGNFLLLISTVLIFFLLTEGVTRLVMPNTVKIRLMHRPDEKLGFRLVPNYKMRYKTSEFDTSIKINSEGLRDCEYQKDKDSTTFRILVLGDSFSFGFGVNLEDSYPKILEAMLNNKVNGRVKKYEVINAGVDGYGTGQEYIYLEELGNRYKPDLVIVGLYSNDVQDVMAGIPSAFAKTRVKNRFYFLSYLRGLQILLARTVKEDIRSEVLQIYQDTYSPRFENALQKTKEYLIKIRDFSHSIDSETLILIIPLTFEIDRSNWKKKGLGKLCGEDFFDKNMSKFSDIFTGFGKKEDIPTLPLLPIFRNSKVMPLYFTRDPHWTKEGHRLAAESIYNFLIEKRLIHEE